MPSVHFMSMLASVGALALLGAAPSPFAAVTTYTVGGEKPPLCDFGTIQAAVDAAAAAGGGKPFNIHVATDAAYISQAISIDNLNLNIVGGFANCGGSITPGAHTTISGAGNFGYSVILITGTSNVTLQNLTITGGGGARGGGIDFEGNGTLTLADSTVSNNNAGFGGGIRVAGGGGTATLALNANVLIQDNSAVVYGGGIFLVGTAHLLMSGSGTQVSSNHADEGPDGFGGGIFMAGPAQADIGAPGIGSHGAIYNNTAVYGAGIYVQGYTAIPARVNLFTTDPAHPVFLDSNHANSGFGGALYLDARLGPAVACVFEARISANSALYSSAVYSDHGQLYMNTNPGGVCNSAALAATVRCTPGPGCNEISGNVDTGDAGIMFLANGILQADRIIFRGANASAYAISSYYGASHVSNCLISGNHFKYGLISNYGAGDFILDGCTTAGNAVDSGFVFDSESGDLSNPNHFVLTNSVIYESAGYKTFINVDANGDGILQADYDLLRDTSTVTQGSHYFSADPQFLDPANGDYHLQLTSPVIDFAPAAGGIDLDGSPRDVVVYDDVTPRDIGAYEYQIGMPDRVFADGFDRL